MRYFKKWIIILLAVFVAEIAFESCSKHHRHKKMIKRRKSALKHRYHSPYQKKLKRSTLPINVNYVIKNKRNRKGAPNSDPYKY